ncbi:outer membrane lipoprotein chaperone LolA [Spiribacter sp. C176]|uniref:Outer-membrane lipoprotein carrier protein n=1 Tax=Spiribacter salilacus TaxID=2664894 RepID=A0A6N7QR21_9GAMM|nr:outer membrane lipoprotein chaperone LolA [Spiribacter salilacus]MRH78881.1 outer membrane lipoprotein chaperone LolA [Spiribacter salilacus]
MSYRFCLSILMAVWVLFATGAQADALEELERYFSEVNTLSGQFIQETSDSTGAVVETAEGEFFIARPERFVWDYSLPYEQQIVADGQQLWVYDVDLDQVVVRPLGEALGVGAAQLLSGDIDSLSASFEIQIGDNDDVLLKPTDPAWAFQEIRLQFSQGIPQRMEIADGMDQTVTVEFEEVIVNPSIPDRRFEFVVPDGVDVIEGS